MRSAPKDDSLTWPFATVRRVGLLLAAGGTLYIFFLIWICFPSYESMFFACVWIGGAMVFGCALKFGSDRLASWAKVLMAAMGYLVAGVWAFAPLPSFHEYRPLSEDEIDASALQKMTLNLLTYVGDDRTLAQSIKGRSVDELVSMGVLSPSDAVFLKERNVKFYGFEPNLPPGKTILFEEIAPRHPYRHKIICHGDGHARSFLLIARVPEPDPAYRSSRSLPTGDTSKAAPLEFLKDIPALKGVFLGMPEAELLRILAAQNLKFEEAFQGDETSYKARATNDTIVFLAFRDGRCTAIQRLVDKLPATDVWRP